MTGARPNKCEKDIPQFQKGMEFSRIEALLKEATNTFVPSELTTNSFSLEILSNHWISQSYQQQTVQQKEFILSLQKKYALFKRLFSSYGNDLRKNTDEELSHHGYSLLGLCFLQWFQETHNYNFLNTSINIWERLQKEKPNEASFLGYSYRLQNILKELQYA